MPKTFTYSHDEINRAIFGVITSEYKKDNPEAFKIVERLGYQIFKEHGHFFVDNYRTNKSVTASMGTSYIHITLNTKTISFGYYDKCLIDFYSYLEKPYNKTFHPLKRYNKLSESHARYEHLIGIKHDIDYYTKRIEEIQRQIEELNTSLIDATEMKMTYKHKLEKYKKQYGLIKED